MSDTEGQTPLVGPEVEVWKIALHAGQGSHSSPWIEIRSDGKAGWKGGGLDGPKNQTSFEGTWSSGLGTDDHPSSYVWQCQLKLQADGRAEYFAEEGHEELRRQAPPQYVRDRVVRRLVGKWKQTGEKTATVWLRPFTGQHPGGGERIEL